MSKKPLINMHQRARTLAERQRNFMHLQMKNSVLLKPIARALRMMFQHGLPNGWGVK